MENINPPGNSCTCCASPFQHLDAFCNALGYPLGGSEQEQQYFITARNNREIDLEEVKKKMNTATKTLYWVAGLTGFWSIIEIFSLASGDEQFAAAIVTVIVVGLFVFFGVLSKTRSLTAMICGLSLFLIIQVINAVVEPATIVKGILFKILVIGGLINGIYAAIEAEKIKKELNLD